VENSPCSATENDGDEMQIIIATLSLALLMWVEVASAQSTYSMSVSRHSGVPRLSEEKVKEILASASKMLQKNPGHRDTEDDVACNVTFSLKGPVRTFSSPAKIVDEDNIAAVHRIDSDVDGVDFHVKVVEELKFCRQGLSGHFAGCSFSPPEFRSMIVVHPALHRNSQGHILATFPDHLLWAHEFGHMTGLGHRDDEPLALMTRCPLNTQFSGTPDARVQVKRDECRHLLGGPGSRPPDPLPETPACRLPK
jgi:hypothetical protein